MNIDDYGLILANDETDTRKVIELTKNTAPFLKAVKIGITSSMEPGISIFRDLKKELSSLPLIADFKTADIGFFNPAKNEWEGTNEKIVRKLTEAGADYITCHAINGTSSIQECVDTAHKLGGKILTLPYMTHKGANIVFDQPINMPFTISELDKLGLSKAVKKIEEIEKRKAVEKWRLPYVSVSDMVLAIGEAVNVDGYIGPANEQPVLDDYRKVSDKATFTPGIGRQKRKEDMTPEQQIENVFRTLGPKSGVIVGSAIYGSQDPTKSAEEFMKYASNAKSNLLKTSR